MNPETLSETIRALSCAAEGMEAARGRYPESGLCVFGTDGLSVAADAVSDIANDMSPVPVPAVHGYVVPGWVSGNIAAVLSIRGDDPEILRLYGELRARGCTVVCVTGEGPLADACRSDGCALFVPDPDSSEFGKICFATGVLVSVCAGAGIFDASGELLRATESAAEFADKSEETARKIAEFIGNGVPAVYSTSDIRACSCRWRHLLSSRGPSFCGELPEFDHNELVGWADPNAHAPDLRMIVLRGTDGAGMVPGIVSCMLEVLGENGRDVFAADIGGGSPAEKNLRAMVLAETVAGML